MSSKRKLLVVAGAGSAIEFGMPSVGDIHDFLLKAADQYFSLTSDSSKNLYGFLYDEIKKYWARNVDKQLKESPNFEVVLHTIFALASLYPAGTFTGTLGAFVETKDFPQVNYIGQTKPTDENIISHLGQQMVDKLMDEFRKRCREIDTSKIVKLQIFFSKLADQFDVAVVTTNYDDLIYKSIPDIETGFDPASGIFDQGRILRRSPWPCLLHLHGSVHFDMRVMDTNLHTVTWQNDLSKQFNQNSMGRSSVYTIEGNKFPTSSIIAGYGKTEQIQRAPFRTYYSELDRLVYESDSVLFLGFSLVDTHVREAFADYRDGRDRPVVFIDYAEDETLLAGWSSTPADTGPTRAMDVFKVAQRTMEWLGNKYPDNVSKIKAAHDFERSRKPGRRLSIWYNGMAKACGNVDKIIQELSL